MSRQLDDLIIGGRRQSTSTSRVTYVVFGKAGGFTPA
jgi:hypothetical protein